MASVPEAIPQHPIRRYSNTAVALHWITVALVLTQVVLGFAFAEFMDRGPAQARVFAWHKTLGALILVIALIRLGYRLSNPPPPFPPELPRWRRNAAVWNHRAFYALAVHAAAYWPHCRFRHVTRWPHGPRRRHSHPHHTGNRPRHG